MEPSKVLGLRVRAGKDHGEQGEEQTEELGPRGGEDADSSQRERVRAIQRRSGSNVQTSCRRQGRQLPGQIRVHEAWER